LSNSAIEVLQTKLSDLEADCEEQKEYTKAVKADYNSALNQLRDYQKQIKEVKEAVRSLENSGKVQKEER
jgi:hypothetical protein